MDQFLSHQTEGLSIIHGRVANRILVKDLTEFIKEIGLTGTLYQGYLLPFKADNLITVDILLVSKQHGLLAFTFAHKSDDKDADFWESIAKKQDDIFFALRNHLTRQEGLRERRKDIIIPQIITILPKLENPPSDEILVSTIENVNRHILEMSPIDDRYWRALNAAIENVTTIKPPKKRSNLTKPDSRGSILKRIEASISNLDYWQKRAALETPESPQRIRGLAGSGKTVVLAMKAAALHAQNPDWDIAVTFFTRALHQQFKDLITRFSFEYKRDEPDYEKLRILHSWGGRGREGLYSIFSRHLDVTPGDWVYASSKYGRERAFSGLCDELLAVAKYKGVEPIFDAVLIDEAQDLPLNFFRLVDLFCRAPHRIVFAYDELQKLDIEPMKEPEEIFIDDEGNPKYSFENEEGQPRRDEVLPVCYRNTPWALTLAHALGFGIHREGNKLAQHFTNYQRWERVGYKVEEGRLEPGCSVVLIRDSNSFPDYFEEELNIDDVIIANKFNNDVEQAEATAENILVNLTQDELEHDDFLIILPDPYESKSNYAVIKEALKRRNINSHLVGVDTSLEDIFLKDSIAVTHIYRAKGNEAPMVYIVNANRYLSKYKSSSREIIGRNMLFTAITRSRAWVRIFGVGDYMQKLLNEISVVQKDDYKLIFTLPTLGELEDMERLYKSAMPEEREMQKETADRISWLTSAIKRGDLKKEDISEEDLALLKEFIEQ
jgi:superfamily I DNA and RNA helicase